MGSTRIAVVLTVIGLMICLWAGIAPAAEVGATIAATADRLLQEQGTAGPLAGNWKIGFNGSIVTGMVCAYEYTGHEAYLDAAKLGADFIIFDGGKSLYGDDACALMKLSQVADDPATNPWRSVLSSFYEHIRSEQGSTYTYLDWFQQPDPSTAVFYLAHHVVATNYIDDADKDLWRSKLITLLAGVTDEKAEYPVMALGVATWALAQTGPLDQTPIGDGAAATWAGKTLADLPALLLSHQVPENVENAGAFYWRFDHKDDGSGAAVSGYTEDTVFAVLGLRAVSRAYPEIPAAAAVAAAREALLAAPDGEGRVHVSLAGYGPAHPVLAGELLQVLPELDTAWAMNKGAASGPTGAGEPAGAGIGAARSAGDLHRERLLLPSR